jgi:DNA primase
MLKSKLVYQDFNSKFHHGLVDTFFNYITIPLIKSGNVTSFTSRACGDQVRLKHKHLNGGFSHFYNVDTIENTKDFLFLVESPIDTIIMEQEGFNTISAFGTNGVRNKFLEDLKGFTKPFYILFDTDLNNAGLVGAHRAALFIYQNTGIPPYILQIKSSDEEKVSIDINNLYLLKRREFKNIINSTIEKAIFYLDTDHYKNHLKSLEKKESKIKLSEEVRLTLSNIRNIPLSFIISRYINLQQTPFGAIGKCPFHQDTHSSFIIYNNTNMFFCFSGVCGVKGNAIDFYQKYFKLTFHEALKKLKLDLNL